MKQSLVLMLSLALLFVFFSFTAENKDEVKWIGDSRIQINGLINNSKLILFVGEQVSNTSIQIQKKSGEIIYNQIVDIEPMSEIEINIPDYKKKENIIKVTIPENETGGEETLEGEF